MNNEFLLFSIAYLFHGRVVYNICKPETRFNLGTWITDWTTRTRDQTKKLLKNCECSSVIFCKFILIVHKLIFASYNFHENSDFCKSWNGVGASLVRDGKASSCLHGY